MNMHKWQYSSEWMTNMKIWSSFYNDFDWLEIFEKIADADV